MYVPIMFDLKGKPVTVAGGGRAACRKIRALLDGGAAVTVICPRGLPVLEKWAVSGRVNWIRRCWQNSDSKDAVLIFAATDDHQLNERIVKTAEPHQLVHVSGRYEEGDFVLPAVLRRGRLTISVSTGGASPDVAKQIRDTLSEHLDDDIEGYLDFLFQIRNAMKGKLHDPAQKALCFKRLLHPVYRDPIQQKNALADIDQFIAHLLKHNPDHLH